ncbi:MAG TPA: helix-turn-helix transcriptional regulator [Verrucomicrobiae bacterium]|nr:helix-turn-helix transcriptional regulator [Verrucomicrobiae bacterium]
MQANFITQPAASGEAAYDVLMHAGGRPTDKPRSPLGQRIAAARELAGISQAQLAEHLGVTQPTVAYWERKAVNIRSDVLTKIARALNVSTDEVLGTKTPRTSSKPVGKARRVFESVSKLPRRQQEKIVEVVEAMVEKHGKGS